MGATTIWERWDSMLPDGSINPGEMTSARVRLAPRPGGGITWASTSLETPHGLVSSRWRLEDGVLTLDASLPDGVTGVVSLPGEPDVEVTGVARVVS